MDKSTRKKFEYNVNSRRFKISNFFPRFLSTIFSFCSRWYVSLVETVLRDRTRYIIFFDSFYSLARVGFISLIYFSINDEVYSTRKSLGGGHVWRDYKGIYNATSRALLQ